MYIIMPGVMYIECNTREHGVMYIECNTREHIIIPCVMYIDDIIIPGLMYVDDVMVPCVLYIIMPKYDPMCEQKTLWRIKCCFLSPTWSQYRCIWQYTAYTHASIAKPYSLVLPLLFESIDLVLYWTVRNNPIVNQLLCSIYFSHSSLKSYNEKPILNYTVNIMTCALEPITCSADLHNYL